jgi:hypothetical protein
LDRGSWLKAGGIFLLSLGMAAGVGLAFSSLSPAPECGFPVMMAREPVDVGMRATIISVDGEFQVDQVGYRVVVLGDGSSGVLMEGNLTDALEGGGPVSYYPTDPSAGVLRAGDYLLVESEEDIHVILLAGGTPVGWTAGCV